MLNRKVLVVLGFLLLAPVAANACPLCRYSPNNWGFCRYGFDVGFYDCETVVVDEWTGRTNCNVCGYCNGYHPEQNQGCNAGGDDPDCGLVTPCDQSLKALGLPGPSCGSRSRITSGNDLNWMDARVDQVVMF